MVRLELSYGNWVWEGVDVEMGMVFWNISKIESKGYVGSKKQ